MAGRERQAGAAGVVAGAAGVSLFIAAIALATALAAGHHPSTTVLVWFALVAATAAAALAAHRRDRAARDAAVAAFVAALAAKDPYTGEHTERVARYSVWVGEELGLSRRRLADLERAALVHDVGKLLLPTSLLAKPDRLTEREFRHVQRHAHVCDGLLGAVDVLRPFTAVAAGHHRRYDGQGYGGRRHPGLAAAIVAVADAYDAMTSTRAYRRALPQATAFAELRAGAGAQFHPACVAALITAVQRRGVRHGLGFEHSAVVYDVDPPVLGPGSAGVPRREAPVLLPAPVHAS